MTIPLTVVCRVKMTVDHHLALIDAIIRAAGTVVALAAVAAVHDIDVNVDVIARLAMLAAVFANPVAQLDQFLNVLLHCVSNLDMGIASSSISGMQLT